ncbi:MAG: D-alanine--D-alanine ligase family protein [Syntrophales bacterium]
MKHCLIIYNEPAADALPDELDVLEQVHFIQEVLRKIGHRVSLRGITDDLVREIACIAGQGFDYVFNLVESIGNKAEILYFAPALLNCHHLPYTGCPLEAVFATASKVLARKIMAANGIPIAAGYRVTEVDNLVPGKKYILKPVWEDGSLGITEESVFTFEGTPPGMLAGKNDEHWFIEEFIDGREFHVSVLGGPGGPEALPAAEMVFRNYSDRIHKIVSYKAKWVESSFQYKNCRRIFPSDLSEQLRTALRKTVLDCWHTFGLRGYARIDMRIDRDEQIHVLEVNANPRITTHSGIIAAGAAAGYTQAEIVGRIVDDLNTCSAHRKG